MVRAIQTSLLSDNRLFRETVSSRLACEVGIEVVVAAATVHELLVSARARPVEVLLVHFIEESARSAEAVWDIKALLPAARVIVLGLDEDEAEVVRWIEAGALACLEHDTPYAALVETIRAVAQGRTTCSPRLLTRVIHRLDELAGATPRAPSVAQQSLSERENEVLELMNLGLMNKQIARRLGVRPPTVKSHVHSILHKLHVRRRRDVPGRAQEGGTLGEG